MPLRAYVRPRLVILAPQASAIEAARAIEKNNIGAVVVQDAGRVSGSSRTATSRYACSRPVSIRRARRSPK